MPYITVEELEHRAGEGLALVLGDRDNNGELDPGPIERAITDASAEIDSYLGHRYELPLSQVPDVLLRVATDVAIYRLANTEDVLTEEMRTRYEDARSWLRDVAKGNASLGVPTQEEPATVNSGVVRLGPPRVWSRQRRGGPLF